MKQENDINSEMGKLVEASWNPFDPDFLINPYPQYELLRDQDPVHRTAFGNLVVTRFDDVFEAGGFGGGYVRGVLLDLGVSSPQLDDRHRGFNVYEDVPLDMRMNPNVGVPAWQWLMEVTVEGLAWVIYAYGEDDDYLLSERIASALVESRPTWGRMLTCRHAAAIVSGIVRSGGYIRPMNPARLTFQAIRVYLNQEMQQLDSVLNGVFRALVVGGRCSVISFKRMESDAVLRFVRQREEPPESMLGLPQRERCEMWPLLQTDVLYTVVHVGQPIKPAPTEVQNNNRCRSSKVYLLRKGLRVSSCLPDPLRQQLQLRPSVIAWSLQSLLYSAGRDSGCGGCPGRG